MRYESLLAARYLKSQKRQSAFTVISIAAAIAVMTMLFVLYGTIMDNLRTKAYNEAPYHLLISNWPENKATMLRNREHVESVEFERVYKGILAAKIILDGDVDNEKLWLENLEIDVQQERIEKGIHADSLMASWNEDLMLYDRIGTDAILARFRIFWFFLVFVLLFSIALRLVVDTAFEISARERERHYGVLESIGATPGQIAGIITREALRLCVVAVPIGLALGVLLALGVYRAVLSAGLSDVLGTESGRAFQPRFLVQPHLLLIAAGVGLVWTFFSAYGVGMRVVKKTPMEAITARAKRVKKSKKNGAFGKLTKKRSVSSMIFGLPGSIAYRNARRQKKHFRITVLTLTVSIALFAIFTSVADCVENFICQSYADGYSMFAVTLRNDPASGQTVLDAAEALHACNLFEDVQVEAFSGIETGYERTENYIDGPYTYKADVFVVFVDRVEYARIFGENPPVSYEDLAKSGSFVYVPYPADAEEYSDPSDVPSSIRSDAEAGKMTLYPGYEKEEPPAGAMDWSEPETHPVEISVSAVRETDAPMIPREIGGSTYENALIGTLDTCMEVHDEWFGENSDHSCWPCANLCGCKLTECSNAEYQRIQTFFRMHANTMENEYDNYSMVLDIQNLISSLRAGVLLVNCIIAVAALINLLNIVCTGIANRRSELASLQCVGMTEGQLLRMTLIECFQYVAKAALISALLCGAVVLFLRLAMPSMMETLYGSDWVLYVTDEDGGMLLDMVKLDTAGMFARIALASAAAFAAGCAASVAMLRAQSKQSLSERVRNAE